MIRVTRQYRFSASHRLHASSLSDERNREVYGKCNNPFGHGHDYVLQVSAEGPVDEETGLAVHTGALDDLVRRSVLEEVSNSDLNSIGAFHHSAPTTENLAAEIERRLSLGWEAVFGAAPRLASIRIQETKRNAFETEGPPRA